MSSYGNIVKILFSENIKLYLFMQYNRKSLAICVLPFFWYYNEWHKNTINWLLESFRGHIFKTGLTGLRWSCWQGYASQSQQTISSFLSNL
jgi:hypothetical protein